MWEIKYIEQLSNVSKVSKLVRTGPQSFNLGTTPELNFNRPNNGLKRSHYKMKVSTPEGS